MSGLPVPVLVVGTGLIGTSLALSLRRAGAHGAGSRTRIRSRLAVAVDLGAGEPLSAQSPPAWSRRRWGWSWWLCPGRHRHGHQRSCSGATRGLRHGCGIGEGPDPPIAGRRGCAGRTLRGWAPDGRQRGVRPAAARADLIDDRPWVLTPHAESDEEAVEAVQELVLAARALPVMMPAAEHDRAVAVVSHAPQILASLLAARLLDSSDTVVSIAGQGLRDMTRIAASDANLWVEILSANASPVASVLGEVADDLAALLSALGSIDQGGQDVLAQALRRGNAGRDRVPGKHGARPAPTAVVPVAVPDRPGELGRLFAAVADAGFSVEDVRIEHVLGRPTGVVEITVGEAAAGPLIDALGAGGSDVRA